MTVEVGPQPELAGFKDRQVFQSLQQTFAMTRPRGLRSSGISGVETTQRIDESSSHQTLTVTRTLDGGTTQAFFLTLEDKFLTLEDKFGEESKLTGVFKLTKAGVEEQNVSDKRKVVVALNMLAASAFYGQILFYEQFAEWTKEVDEKIEFIFKPEEAKAQ